MTEFDVNVHPNGVRVSKQLTNKTAPRVASDAVLTDLDLIAFGTGLAYGGTMTFFHTWTVNGRTDNRVNNDGSVGSVRPSFLLVDDDNPLLRVTLTVAPDPGITLEAYLHLLGQHFRHGQSNMFPNMYHILHSHRPSCHSKCSEG